MKKVLGILLVIIGIQTVVLGSSNLDLMPWPNSIAAQDGTFKLNKSVPVKVLGDNQDNGRYLSELCGLDLKEVSRIKGKGIYLITDETISSDEGYRLEISRDNITIKGKTDQGVFYGIQTLKQLVPADVLNNGQIKTCQLPCVVIEDEPRFKMRGLMIDSSRHFQSVEFIKKYIDIIAGLKLNVLHWHLTDNNGWRIQIDKYPRLTSIGGFLSDGRQMQRNGFYSKADIREVVRYAKGRHVTIIPEIDVPGHAAAMVEAYPEFLCPSNRDKKPVSQRTYNADYHEILCVGNEKLYSVLSDIFDEVIEVFGCEYVHIGGDEVGEGIWSKCPLCKKVMEEKKFSKEPQLQRYFMEKVNTMLAEKGATSMAWIEHLETGIPKGQLGLVWRTNLNNALEAPKRGVDIINADGRYAYFDYPDYPGTGKSGWMPVLDLKKVYSYDVVHKQLSAEQGRHVRGGICTLWTEEVLMEDMDKQLFPRLLAFSEQMWTDEKQKDWDDFYARVQTMEPRFNAMGVRYSHKPDPMKVELVYPATFETTMQTYRSCWPQYALDGRDTTWFISSDNVKEGDTFTVIFEKAVKLEWIEAITDSFFCHDEKNGTLKSGILEISEDGRVFRQVGRFIDGTAYASLNTTVKTIRIKALDAQDSKLVIADFRMKVK